MENKNRRSLEDSLNELSKYSRTSNKENLNTTVTIDSTPVRDTELDETTSFEIGAELAKLGERVDNKRQQLNRLYDEITKSINEEELTYVTIEPDYHNVSLNKSKQGVHDSTPDTTLTRNDEDEELWNLRRRPPQPLALKLPVAQLDFRVPSSESMLKHVHFETLVDDDAEPPSKQVVATKIPNKSAPATPNRPVTSAFSNKTSSANTSCASKKESSLKPKTPPAKSPAKTSAKVAVVKTAVTTKASPSFQTTKNVVKLTYEEKRLKAVEEKAKMVKSLEILRIKVVRRKFAYIWLRRYFYGPKSKSSNKRLLLPSQAK